MKIKIKSNKKEYGDDVLFREEQKMRRDLRVAAYCEELGGVVLNPDKKINSFGFSSDEVEDDS